MLKVNRPGVDYVVIEYKFGSSTLGRTKDGLQMSDSWLAGSVTGNDRILQSVGNPIDVAKITNSLALGRVEKWVVHTDPFGKVTIGVVDINGKFSPKQTSAVLGDRK